MKNPILYTLLTVIISITVLPAQEFIELIKTQNYDELSLTLTEDVNLKMDDGTKVKGEGAVISALKKRLSEFNPIKVETKHKGSSGQKETDYLIAKLFNANGEGMRIFIHLENSAKGRKICDIKLRDL